MTDNKELKVQPEYIVNLLPRQDNRTYNWRNTSSIEYVVLHTTDWDTTPTKLAAYDIAPYVMVNGKKYWNHISKKGCPAITYHECVTTDKVYQTLDYEEESWHSGKWNKNSIAVAMMYKASISGSKEENPPPKYMTELAQTRCADLCLKFGLSPDRIKGHRELKGTGWFWSKGSKKLRKTCPGKHVDMDKIRYNAAIYMQVKLKAKKLYLGQIDGIFGPKSMKALETLNGCG